MNVFARMLVVMRVVLPLVNGRSLNIKSVTYKKKRKRQWLKSYSFISNSNSSILALRTCYIRVLKL